VNRSKAGNQNGGDYDDCPEHDVLVLGALGPEVNRDDSQAIQAVEQNSNNQSKFRQSNNRSLV
jgi:hypothetical protein